MPQWLINNLGTIILVLVVFGPIIANVLRAANQAKKQKDSSGTPEDAARPSRPEELAARRRAELGGGPVAGRAGGGDPSNLTMAERIARARAKAQYEQRSSDLSRGAGRVEPADDVEIEVVEPGGGPDTRRREAEAAERRRRQEQQAALERRRAAERREAEMVERRRREQAEAARREATRRREAEQARPAGSERRASTRQASSGRTGQAASTGRPRRGSRAGVGDIDVDAITRGEVGTGRSAPQFGDASGRAIGGGRTGERHASVFGVRLTRRTLRHAIVLREILDPPVALRQGEPGVSSGGARA